MKISINSRRHARRAFTFIEIMLTVTIISILAALVVPRIAGASDSASAVAVKAQLRQVRTQLELYKVRNFNYPRRIEKLVSSGYLRALPDHPGIEQFRYTPATGRFYSPLDKTW